MHDGSQEKYKMKKINEYPKERERQAADKSQAYACTSIDVDAATKSHRNTTHRRIWLECQLRLDQLMRQCYEGTQ
jgi:hypothetical protein